MEIFAGLAGMIYGFVNNVLHDHQLANTINGIFYNLGVFGAP